MQSVRLACSSSSRDVSLYRCCGTSSQTVVLVFVLQGAEQKNIVWLAELDEKTSFCSQQLDQRPVSFHGC